MVILGALALLAVTAFVAHQQGLFREASDEVATTRLTAVLAFLGVAATQVVVMFGLLLRHSVDTRTHLLAVAEQSRAQAQAEVERAAAQAEAQQRQIEREDQQAEQYGRGSSASPTKLGMPTLATR